MAARPFVPVAPHLPTEFVEVEDITLGPEDRWEGLSLTAQFDGQVAEDLDVSGCRVVDANLRMCTGKRVRFDHCDLSGAELQAARFAGGCFFDSDLTGVDLSQASLDQARLHGSTIGSLRGAAALRGTTIASAQLVPVALQLLALFEIHVDDEKEPPPP